LRRLSALLLCLGLAACGRGSDQAEAEDPKYAGLDQQIRVWRAEIVKTDETCQSEAKDQKCVEFEVTCKVDKPLTEAEQEAGLISKVIVAVRWQGWNTANDEHRAVLRAAEFTKTGKNWLRKDAGGVNPSTCATY
jgi:hypothetical protein